MPACGRFCGLVEGVMLTLVGEQVKCLWDEVLPAAVRELPEDLARLDRVLADSRLLLPIAQAWEAGARLLGVEGRTPPDRRKAPSPAPFRVPPLGIEPRTFGLRVRCSAS